MSNEYKLSQSSNKFNITHQASLQIEQDFQLVPHHTTNINGKKKKKKKEFVNKEANCYRRYKFTIIKSHTQCTRLLLLQGLRKIVK